MARPSALAVILVLSGLVAACADDGVSVVAEPVVSECADCVTEDRATEINDAIAEEFALHGHVPGMVVAIQSPEGTYEAAFGLANAETGEAMSADAVFGIGSVHKLFKWVALHLVAQDGLVDLDEQVNRYVATPVLPGVTMRHLMQHSSGLPDLPDIEAYNAAIAADQTQQLGYEDVLAMLETAEGSNSYGAFTNGRLVNFTLGESMSYSSIGPLVGLRIVEAVTSTDAHSFTAERIFEPLELADTSHMAIAPDPVRLTEGHATSDTVNPFFPDAASTMALSSANGGAIHSTARDVATFGHAVFADDGLLTAETQAQLFAAPVAGPGLRAGNGVIQFDEWRDSGWWGHAGFGIRSHSTTLLHQPDLDLTVVVMTNLYTPLDEFETNVAVSDAVRRVFAP